MRMQVILDSLFSRPGSTPVKGAWKGEFRDWTTEICVRWCVLPRSNEQKVTKVRESHVFLFYLIFPRMFENTQRRNHYTFARSILRDKFRNSFSLSSVKVRLLVFPTFYFRSPNHLPWVSSRHQRIKWKVPKGFFPAFKFQRENPSGNQISTENVKTFVKVLALLDLVIIIIIRIIFNEGIQYSNIKTEVAIPRNV